MNWKITELVLHPLGVPMDGVPGDVQMEIIELQYSDVWLFDFRSKYRVTQKNGNL